MSEQNLFVAYVNPARVSEGISNTKFSQTYSHTELVECRGKIGN